MRNRIFVRSSQSVCLFALTIAAHGRAAPTLRTQVSQHGDFTMFGNTLGWDCANSAAAVLTGTVTCNGVGNTGDSGIDIYWRSDQPATGQALASSAITMANARSTAMLALPSGARITYARLYWAAYLPAGGVADTTALIERPGTAYTQSVTADASWTAAVAGGNGELWYQSSADITDLLLNAGPGAFRVSGVTGADLTTLGNNTLGANVVMAGWAVVVLYARDADPPRNLALFDGLDSVGPGQAQDATINGFLVPLAGFTAKLGVIAYEGDDTITGDQFLFNGTVVSDALNPANNFFNATHSNLGVGVNTVGDLPRLSGAPRSMGGVDLDTVDITSLVHQGDESATIRATSTNDRYVLGAFVTSISTFKPDFTSSGKTVRDINGGAIRPGDVLEYTVTVTNSGNDTSTNTVMTDVLPTQVTYVPGSLALVAPTAQVLTDATSDDAGEYNATTRTITVRLGTGADATTGGTMAVGDTITLKFQVTLNANASGTIENQANITAGGQLGAPVGSFPTDGNGPTTGAPPTTTTIDDCSDDTDCTSIALPYCDISSSPHVCVSCVTSAQCTSATAPECNLTTHVCECPSGTSSCQDSDGDGLTDTTEVTIGTNPNDADSDDDGVPDGSELAPGTDSDGDGLINALDPDSDNDGLFDGTEMGLGCGGAGTDLTANRCVADGDLGATKTNPLSADTDGGGKTDGSEDANLNGVVDTGETDPTVGHSADDATVVDSDGDGLSDLVETYLGSDPNDQDSDDDGVIDGLEPNPSDDVDHDGLKDVSDADSDGDGLFDGTEMGLGCTNGDTDLAANHCIADADAGQTRTSPLIPDTDHGGMSDGAEDTNHDGRVDTGERNPNDPIDDTAQCYADAECGAVDSGRVCDANHVCINGVRGLGGNGCPAGQTCSSTNDLIGACSGATGTGGASSIGGASSTGGVSSAGGVSATGGLTSAGGVSATGGVANGGTSTQGGASATGGASVVVTAGSTALGGTSGIGGSATAGDTSMGGTSETAGASAGGDTAVAGATGTGGAAGSSSTEAGGATGTGGAAAGGESAIAGSVSTGGQSVAPTTETTPGSALPEGTSVEGGGCGCRVATRNNQAGAWIGLVGAALLLLRRRRHR